MLKMGLVAGCCAVLGCGSAPEAMPNPDGASAAVGGCDPGGFAGKAYSTVETTMNACYGMWRYRTSAEVQHCPSDRTAWRCEYPLVFFLSNGTIIGWTQR
jgi:hypothetical protein